jgi:transposase-like protein
MPSSFEYSACPFCHSTQIVRKGTRKNQVRVVQLFQCKTCQRYFSSTPLGGVKYHPFHILKALSFYNLGYPQSRVSSLLASRHHVKVPQRTISSWIARYAGLCAFKNLRPRAMRLFPPAQMICTQRLEHRQVYRYKFHRAKLDLLEGALPRREDYARLRTYLLSVSGGEFPHRLFIHGDALAAAPKHLARRSSQLQLNFLPVLGSRKENLANVLARHGLLLANTNRARHEQIQEFMLFNDSATLACEVPVFLTADNIRYFHGKGFYLPLPEEETPITGHIDILQVRQRYIHILDYKPEAGKTQPISQLTLYALALASQTRLPLKLFKCAWFDENDYFEFYPLQATYGKRGAEAGAPSAYGPYHGGSGG